MEKQNRSKESLENIHKFSSKHRNSIMKSKTCGCFHCLNIFSPNEIIEYVDKDSNGIGQTALCPKCGIDSVIGDNDIKDMTNDFLTKMKEHYF